MEQASILAYKRSQTDAFEESQFDLDWQFTKHAKVASSPAVDLYQYLDLEQSTFSAQTPETEILHVDIEVARRKIETVGERWQERIRQQVQDLNMAPPHQYAEVLERLLKLEDVCAIQSRSIRLLEDRLSATERGPLRTPTISESLASSSHKDDLSQEQSWERYTKVPDRGVLHDVARSGSPITSSTTALSVSSISRVVRLKNLPRSYTFYRVLQLIRGGPVEQILYHDGEEIAVVWFISAESATRCLDHAAHHDIVVDEHLIVYERLNTHLSKSPPKPSILTAPERKISNTIYVDGCSMSLSVVKNDFGTIIYCERLQSGTIRIIFSAIHDAIMAMRSVTHCKEYKANEIRFHEDECSATLEHSWLLKESSKPKAASQSSEDSHSQTASGTKVVLPSAPQSDAIFSTEVHNSGLSDAYKPVFCRTRSPKLQTTPRARPRNVPKPKGVCRYCGTLHWVTGIHKTPCRDSAAEPPRKNSRFDQRQRPSRHCSNEEATKEVGGEISQRFDRQHD